MTELRAARSTRRQDFSAATRRDLIDVAERLFTEQGYAATSLDSVVAGACVTKGALYHHFSGKQGIFEAVFERIEHESARALERAVDAHEDPWAQAAAGLRSFLAVVREPGYRRIVIQEGPAVLGHERFREEEERSTFGLVRTILHRILVSGGWELDEDTVRIFSRLFFGALNTAGAAVATSSDPEADSTRAEQVIGLMLASMRQLVGSGADLETITGSVLDTHTR